MAMLPSEPDLIHLHFSQDSFGFDLHPGRRQWAFVSKWGKAQATETHEHALMQGMADLKLMPQEGGFPQSLGLLQTSLGAPLWSPDGQYLAWAGAKGIWIYQLATHTLKQLNPQEVCQIEANKMCASGGQFYAHALWHPLLWHPDSGSLFYVLQEEDLQVLYEASIDGKLLRRWYKADGQIMAKAMAPGGSELALAVRFWDGHSGEILRINCQDDSTRRVCELKHCFYLSSLLSYSDNGQLIFRANQGGHAQLWIQTVDEAPRCLDATPADVTSFVLAGNQLYAVQAQADFQDAVIRLGLGSGERDVLLDAQPAGLLVLAVQPEVQPEAQTLYLYKSAVELPGELMAYHWQVPDWRQLTHSHPLRWHHKPLQSAFWPTPCPTVTYFPPDFDPDATYPALIWIKGGPSTSVRQNYQAWPQSLAREGYVVACPNYRGSTGFGVDFLNAGAQGAAGETDLEDIRALAESLRALPYIKSQALGVLGHSWGGYLTLMAVTRFPDLFQCAMASAGLHDLEQQQLLEDVRHYTYWLFGGWSYEQRERYAERSPLSRADQLRTPLLLFHGKEDPNVPFAQVQSFVEKAEKAGAKIEKHFFEGEGHSYQQVGHRKKFYGRATQFFDRYLKPWDFKRNPQGGQHLE